MIELDGSLILYVCFTFSVSECERLVVVLLGDTFSRKTSQYNLLSSVHSGHVVGETFFQSFVFQKRDKRREIVRTKHRCRAPQKEQHKFHGQWTESAPIRFALRIARIFQVNPPYGWCHGSRQQHDTLDKYDQQRRQRPILLDDVWNSSWGKFFVYPGQSFPVCIWRHMCGSDNAWVFVVEHSEGKSVPGNCWRLNYGWEIRTLF